MLVIGKDDKKTYEVYDVSYKLDMKWLFDYYDKLKWRESDMFDGEFEDLLIKNFVESNDGAINTYYEWLIGGDSQ